MSSSRSHGWTVAILGASGAVGRKMLCCLEASSIPVDEVRLLASPRSAGTMLRFRGGELPIRPVDRECFAGVDLALFSAGAAASGEWAPIAQGEGAWVVDNSSRWRMDPAVPLVVPEVNPGAIPRKRCIIANPNCSTIQMVVVLEPIRRRFGLQRVVVATYQAASGKGESGLRALRAERNGEPCDDAVFPGPLFGNLLPQCDLFLDDGFTREEEKMIRETQKILGLPHLPVHPTCVRVPVDVGHAEAVYLVTDRAVSAGDARDVLSTAPGILLRDDPSRSLFPTPRDAAGHEAVWVGRVRGDRFDPRGLHLWIVADNLLKGAALNAIQIAERLRGLEEGA